jgi:Tol biopolymer transport system component
MSPRRFLVLAATIAAVLCIPGIAATALSVGPANTGDLDRGRADPGTHIRPPGQQVRNGLIAFSKFDADAGIDTIWLVDPRDDHQPRQLNPNDYGCPDWSPNGRVLLVCGPQGTSANYLDPHTGQPLRSIPAADPTMGLVCLKWSPEGSRLGCRADDGIYSVRARDGSDLRQITLVSGLDNAVGSYSPDGKSISYWNVPSEDDSGLYVAATNGAGTRRLTDPSVIVVNAPDWSPDGKEILFARRSDPDHRAKLWTIHPDGTHLRQVKLRLPGADCGGAFDDPNSVGCPYAKWSPDGRYLVYVHVAADRVDLQVATAHGRYVRTLTDRMDDGGQRLDVGDPDWQPLPPRH